MMPHTHLRRAWLLYLVLSLTASGCRQATESSSVHPVTVRLTRSASDAAERLPGPYASVLDTAVLIVTSANERVDTMRVRLAQGDTVALFDVRAEVGTARFVARILSNNGTLLFDGSESANVGQTDDTLDIIVKAKSPVLVVSLNYTIVQTPQQRIFSTLVHNRGSGTLFWSIRDTIPPDCRGPGRFCVFNVKTDALAPGFRTLQITMPLNAARPPAIVLTSAGGDVGFP